MYNMKRGLAPIITGVFIILISIIAITIIWLSIKPTLLSPQSSCFGSELNPKIIIESACYDSEANETILVLKRKIDSPDISEIGIIISNNQESTKFSCSNSCGTCTLLSAGERKTYYLPSEEENTPILISILVNDCILDTKKIVICKD